MKILVFKKDNNEFVCPKCGEKIKLNMDKFNNIISSNENIKETIKGIKFQIENIINNNKLSINNINIQLKNINIVLNTIKDDIKKNNEKLKNAITDFNNINNSINKIQSQTIKTEPTYNKPETMNAKTTNNKITSPVIDIIRKGSGITMDMQQKIINCAINSYQKKLKSMSYSLPDAIKQALGGDWIVLNYPKTKPLDFNITIVKGNCYLYFTVDSLAFQVMRI